MSYRGGGGGGGGGGVGISKIKSPNGGDSAGVTTLTTLFEVS